VSCASAAKGTELGGIQSEFGEGMGRECMRCVVVAKGKVPLWCYSGALCRVHRNWRRWMPHNVFDVHGNILIGDKHRRHTRDCYFFAHASRCAAVRNKFPRCCAWRELDCPCTVCNRLPFLYHSDGGRLWGVASAVEIHVALCKRRRDGVGRRVVRLGQHTAGLAHAVRERHLHRLGAQQQLLLVKRLHMNMQMVRTPRAQRTSGERECLLVA
jgi:hypothetical protein